MFRTTSVWTRPSASPIVSPRRDTARPTSYISSGDRPGCRVLSLSPFSTALPLRRFLRSEFCKQRSYGDALVRELIPYLEQLIPAQRSNTAAP
jgi:hypothetical protein